MKKETKKVWLCTSVTEYKTLESYFEKMAGKGWMLSEIKKNSLIFKKIEPRELTFNMSLFYHTTPFDYPNDEAEKDYRFLCEESGWTFCASNAIYQVFFKEKDQEIVPVHTDSKEEYETVKRTFMKSDFFSMIFIPLMSLSGVLRIINFRYDDLLSNMSLFTLISPIFLMMIWLALYMPSMIWFVKNKRNAGNGEALVFATKKQRILSRSIFWSLISVYFLLVIFSLTNGFRGYFIFIIAFTPIIIGLLVGKFCIKRFKTRKRTRKRNLIFFSIVTMITMLVVTSAMMVMISTEGFSYIKNDDMTKEYLVLQLSDFGINATPERIRNYEKTSVLVPVNFEYYESLGRKSKAYEISSVRMTYMSCINEAVADYIFDAYMEEAYEHVKRKIAENLEFGDAEEVAYYRNKISEVLNEFWQVDRGYYLWPNHSEIIIQKSNIIYIFESDVDFSRKEIIDICRAKFGI